MVIKNTKQLSSTKLRKDALKIIESAYEALDIKKLVKKRVKLIGGTLYLSDLLCKEKINLKKYKRVFLVGFGKGAYSAISYVADILKENVYKAVALDIKSYCKPKNPNKKVKVFFGTHPVSSLTNIRATRSITNLLKETTKSDLVIYFVGGGGSSLLCGTLGEYKASKELFKKFTKKGAKISELNIVRKHLSEVKGGGLAKIAYPAKQISLIVSDVCGNDLSTIASGPTVYDKSTIKDAIKIFIKYAISLRGVTFTETPKDKKYFKDSDYFLLACNQDAALGMLETAKKLGYKAKIKNLAVQLLAQKLFNKTLNEVKKGEAIIMAGETTVETHGSGVGGRNQHACLSAIVFNQKNIKNTLVSSFSSDGYDNSSYAGAIVDQKTIAKSNAIKLNPSAFLKNDDSYSFFHIVGDYIYVERKSFNVSDLMFVIRQ